MRLRNGLAAGSCGAFGRGALRGGPSRRFGGVRGPVVGRKWERACFAPASPDGRGLRVRMAVAPPRIARERSNCRRTFRPPACRAEQRARGRAQSPSRCPVCRSDCTWASRWRKGFGCASFLSVRCACRVRGLPRPAGAAARVRAGRARCPPAELLSGGGANGTTGGYLAKTGCLSWYCDSP